MKKPTVQVGLDKYVTDHGERGQCFGCKSFFYDTALMNSQSYCRLCFSKKFPENSTAIFEKSDAKFHCFKECGARNLSFDQFILGICCDPAANFVGNRILF